MNYQESDLAAEEFDQCVRLHTEAHIYNSSFAGRFCDRSLSLVSGLCTTETQFRYRSQKLNLSFSVQLDLTKGATAVKPKFSDTLTLFQPEMAGSAHHMGLVAPKLSAGSVFFFSFETETHSICTLLLCIL